MTNAPAASVLSNEWALIKKDIARQNAVLVRMPAPQRAIAKQSASLWTTEDWEMFFNYWNEMYES